MSFVLNGEGADLPKSLTHGIKIEKDALNKLCGTVHTEPVNFDAAKLTTETDDHKGKVFLVRWKDTIGLESKADNEIYSAFFEGLQTVAATQCVVFDFINDIDKRSATGSYLMDITKIVNGDLSIRIDQKFYPDKVLADFMREKQVKFKKLKQERDRDGDGGGGGSSSSSSSSSSSGGGGSSSNQG
jgi:uncharacterized membrane protein YgcG